MASVQMSQTLRDQITENYKQQLYSAYRKSHNVQGAIDTIVNRITDNDPQFSALCQLQEAHAETLDAVRNRYVTNGYSYHHNNKVSEHIVKTSTELGLICNPNRPTSEDGTYIHSWHTEYKDEYSEGKICPASDNFVEGDIPVKLTDLQPFYAPTELTIRYHRGWGEKQYAPNVGNMAIIVTDPDLCSQLSPIGEIEIKVNTDVETFKEYIDKITTLKRFIDEWPGGKDLVPDEYMQRMLTKKKPAQANRMTPDQIIPNELKEQMNEVILTNKLLGDD
jgi:hypothetical protein